MKYYGMELNAGDRIRIDIGWDGLYSELVDYTVEEFRFSLGIFKSEEHRIMHKFTPLCELFGDGPNTERKYMSNYGEYSTNQIPVFMLLPKENI